MRREVALEEISDGKLYELNDMVKADCHDCEGCCDCCTGMGDSVILDPLDVWRLCTNLGKTAEELFAGELELGVADGNILPHLRMSGKEERCVFLNEQGRCSIHTFRPGFCRLFPLGRYYENNSFKYFLQIHECKKQNRSKIKVRKWVDTPDLKRYEQYINDWHYFLLDVQEVLYNTEDTQLIKNLNLYVVNRFYIKPYDTDKDFYEQFYQRLEEGRGLLELA
ncbi:YkgJ family cysteine cluster protein [Blautia schinkii]|nr:YkgJ family cysteine cluster protein [Blautia schinkii]